MQASLRTTVPQPSENAADGSSISRLVPRMTVDVNFSDVAGESEAGSNQGTPGRPLHHVHSISPSTASFARSPFGSLQHNSVSNCRSIFFSKHCRSIIWSLCLHLSVGHQCKSETIEDNYVSEFSRIIWVIHNLFLFIFCFGFRYSVVSVRWNIFQVQLMLSLNWIPSDLTGSHSKKSSDFLDSMSVPLCSYWISRTSYWPSLNIIARN